MRFLERMKFRRNLVKAFRLGDIYLGDIERPIFPKIRNVYADAEGNPTAVFTLPSGLDPKLVPKGEFVFRQIFGEGIEINGDFKTFVLTVYSGSIPTNLPYIYEDFRDLLSKHKLGIICGKDVNGRYITFDMLKHPHILIAGETGSGKSTQLRSILTSLIQTKKPSELRLFLGDCKKSEFHIFRNVEHVQCVYSSANDIRSMLSHVKRELDERSDLTEVFEVGHIDDLPAEHRRPYLLVCINEFVMLRKDDDIMDVLTEIVAIGRTLGVYAILSMQRPNAQVLDTTIRANLTVSMGFKLRDGIESRIVNTPNAHDIEIAGRFVMNSDKVREIQAPYLEMEDAKALLNPFMISRNRAKDVTERPAQLTEKDVFNDV